MHPLHPADHTAPAWDDARVLAHRPPRPAVDPWRPHGFFVEPERSPGGAVESVATVLIAGKECPFRCLMCDLWKFTTPTRTPDGAVPAQIEYALARLPPAGHVKLYNAGNFFDAQAVPPADLPRVAEQVAPFRSVLVECHPRLVGRAVTDFRDRLRGQLGVAMGLETVHPEVLPRLNKRMTLDDFARATRFLVGNGVAVRAFILLRPPWIGEREGVDWAVRSVEWAFAAGVECCVLIPTRGGNGAMEELARQGVFEQPKLGSLEAAMERALALGGGRVFADLWDVESLATCPRCGPARVGRLRRMNLEQAVPPPVDCDCGAAG